MSRFRLELFQVQRKHLLVNIFTPHPPHTSNCDPQLRQFQHLFVAGVGDSVGHHLLRVEPAGRPNPVNRGRPRQGSSPDQPRPLLLFGERRVDHQGDNGAQHDFLRFGKRSRGRGARGWARERQLRLRFPSDLLLRDGGECVVSNL